MAQHAHYQLHSHASLYHSINYAWFAEVFYKKLLILCVYLCNTLGTHCKLGGIKEVDSQSCNINKINSWVCFITKIQYYACIDEYSDHIAVIGAYAHPFIVAYGFEDNVRLSEKFGVPLKLLSTPPDEFTGWLLHVLDISCIGIVSHPRTPSDHQPTTRKTPCPLFTRQQNTFKFRASSAPTTKHRESPRSLRSHRSILC